jgi:UPF0271 protein
VNTIDLNSDLGEGHGSWSMGDDDALLGVVSSANVACGFHAGDAAIMRHVCEQAAERKVSIGAHVSYRDLAGFGRRFIDMEPDILRQEVIYQLGALDGFARVVGQKVRYIKPHGALYNTIGRHEEQAAAVVAAVRDYDPTLTCLGLSGSAWLRLASEAGLPTAHEAFADRAYTPDGTLVPRKEPGSVLHDADEIARRCVAMVAGEPIADVNGDPITLEVDSICVHGDTAGAVEIAQRVRGALQDSGVTLASFAA